MISGDRACLGIEQGVTHSHSDLDFTLAVEMGVRIKGWWLPSRFLVIYFLVAMGKIHGCGHSDISIFVIHQLDKFIMLDLSIWVNVAMLYKPVSHLRIDLAWEGNRWLIQELTTPDGIISSSIVVLNKSLKLLLLNPQWCHGLCRSLWVWE